MAFGAQMVDLGLPQIVQSLKAQAWSDEVREFCLLLLSFSLWFSNCTFAITNLLNNQLLS